MRRLINNRSFLLTFLTLTLMMVYLMPLHAQGHDMDIKRVLVVNSYHKGYTWSDNIMQGVEEAFSKTGMKVELYIKYLDMKRVSGEEYLLRLKEEYKVGLKDVRFDVVLSADNDALDFLRKYRDELFPGVPVVFCGINDYAQAMLDRRHDLTGVVEDASYRETLNVILSILPKTRHIIIITDKMTTGRAHRAELEKIEPYYKGRADFEYLTMEDHTWDEMGQRLQSLPSDAAVLLLQHNKDRAGESYGVDESTAYLTQRSAVPVFVVVSTRIGFGALGGKVVSGYHQGQVAAEMAISILKGTSPGQIPIMVRGANQYVFDHNVMRRFNIPESALPPGSIIRNKPASFFVEYREQAVAALAVFIVLCLLLLVSLFEIWRRKRAEKALRESEQRFRRVIEKAPISMAIVSMDGIIEYINDKVTQTMGYVAADVPDMEQWWVKAYPDEAYRAVVVARWGGYVRRAEAQGPDIQSDEYQVTCKDGTVKTMLIWGTLVVGKVFVLFNDITERKRVERELLEYRQQLEQEVERRTGELVRLNDQLIQSEKMASLGRLAAGVAHEINNPTAYISNNIAALDKYAESLESVLQLYAELECSLVDIRSLKVEEALKFLRDFKNEADLGHILSDFRHLITETRQGADRIKSIVADLRAFVREDKDEMESADIHEIIERAMSICWNRVRYNIEVVKHYGDLPRVMCHARQLEQVFVNLFVNAADAMDEKGKIIIRTYLKDKAVFVEVEDTGTGISESDLPHVFEPFFTTKEIGKGTGLGLSIVYNILQKHKGGITVTSALGKGTTFCLKLPLA